MSLTDLEAKILKLKCLKEHIPHKASGGRSFLSIPASGSKRQALLVYRSNFRLCFSLHMATSSVRLCPHFLLLMSTQLKVYPTPLWSHLNGLYLQQPYFHIRSCSEVRTSTCLLGVTDFNPWQVLFFHLFSWQTCRKEGQSAGMDIFLSLTCASYFNLHTLHFYQWGHWDSSKSGNLFSDKDP